MFHLILTYVPRPLLIRLSYFFSKLLGLILQGNRFQDPINGKTYRCFLPYGRNKASRRKNALTPETFALERHRLLWLYLQRKTDFFTAKRRMLHVAPEQCFYSLFKKLTNLNYLTADIDSPLADVKMDLHQIDFPDNSFDVIFCNHVLEHVQDDQKCMRELYRVLAPKGWAVLQVPINEENPETYENESIILPDEREKHFGQRDHVRLYGYRSFPERLSAAGFEVQQIDFCAELSPEEIKRYALPKEIIYIGFKK